MRHDDTAHQDREGDAAARARALTWRRHPRCRNTPWRVGRRIATTTEGTPA